MSVESSKVLGEVQEQRRGITKLYLSQPTEADASGSAGVQGYTGHEFLETRTSIKPVAVIKVIEERDINS